MYLRLIFIVHAYKRGTCGHTLTCRYPELKVLTLMYVLVVGCFGRVECLLSLACCNVSKHINLSLDWSDLHV